MFVQSHIQPLPLKTGQWFCWMIYSSVHFFFYSRALPSSHYPHSTAHCLFSSLSPLSLGELERLKLGTFFSLPPNNQKYWFFSRVVVPAISLVYVPNTTYNGVSFNNESKCIFGPFHKNYDFYVILYYSLDNFPFTVLQFSIFFRCNVKCTVTIVFLKYHYSKNLWLVKSRELSAKGQSFSKELFRVKGSQLFL